MVTSHQDRLQSAAALAYLFLTISNLSSLSFLPLFRRLAHPLMLFAAKQGAMSKTKAKMAIMNGLMINKINLKIATFDNKFVM